MMTIKWKWMMILSMGAWGYSGDKIGTIAKGSKNDPWSNYGDDIGDRYYKQYRERLWEHHAKIYYTGNGQLRWEEGDFEING